MALGWNRSNIEEMVRTSSANTPKFAKIHGIMESCQQNTDETDMNIHPISEKS